MRSIAHVVGREAHRRALGVEAHRRALGVEAGARADRVHHDDRQLALGFDAHAGDAHADRASSDALLTHEPEPMPGPSAESVSSWGDVGDVERFENARFSNEGPRPPRVEPAADGSGVWVASSERGYWYLVRNGRCTCRGFIHTGKCKHSAAAREARP